MARLGSKPWARTGAGAGAGSWSSIERGCTCRSMLCRPASARHNRSCYRCRTTIHRSGRWRPPCSTQTSTWGCHSRCCMPCSSTCSRRRSHTSHSMSRTASHGHKRLNGYAARHQHKSQLQNQLHDTTEPKLCTYQALCACINSKPQRASGNQSIMLFTYSSLWRGRRRRRGGQAADILAAVIVARRLALDLPRLRNLLRWKKTVETVYQLQCRNEIPESMHHDEPIKATVLLVHEQFKNTS
jgi:hypothetical protein